ncbi:membrane protein [Anoxybacillus gonensis]|uniref:Metal-dependent hydrolase n=1 Tax=Anoxybacillus gonensis TaxID=198467 RepID=A0AAW7TJR6_9BACL|nr:metal-dependent hydrolase [Anoxybacillus gonensis]AKS37339.1 membrane protein [Anoxybacillus gonensis]KGP62016.1 membrane protein [Anoxybacillus gonensis]MCX8046883.1 metal-dependent hydrolase [Anoxybacillus gonensis]MDO0878230.1 metal-dependent hydrolase [Anoxybacillus gonensis]
MDTGTHVLMGFALGGLATLDPTIANDPTLAHAVLIGTLVGSQAPDIDTVFKLKNNAKYIRNHRGMTHSIPALFIWTLLISVTLFYIYDTSFFHVALWTFIAVSVHVFVDIFNSYGTQALRPFSKKWVALGIINTFDPFIFIVHLAGVVLWLNGQHAGYTFLAVYVVLIGYYIIRFRQQQAIKRKLKQMFPDVEQVITVPTIKWNEWHLAVTTSNHFYVARAQNGTITVLDIFEKCPIPDIPIIEKARQDENLAAFLSFSPVYRWEIHEYNDHYEVRFIDLRYRSKNYYPFVAVVQLDLDLNIVSSYTGWIFSEKKLRKKLELIPS